MPYGRGGSSPLLGTRAREFILWLFSFLPLLFSLTSVIIASMIMLDTLNAPQKEAVMTIDGPVLVLAGPGSGKTRVLTHRIAYLIGDIRIPAWQILAVTFTNKAAAEMNHRIEEILEGKPSGLTMGTFHSVCVRFLRREIDTLPYYERDFVIFDTSDQLQAVKQALSDLNRDPKKYPPNKLLNGISNAKNELILPEEYQATNYIAEITKRVYERYQQILQANNAMDFDDLLFNTVLMFEQHPEILAKYQERYRYILVDEFQDTNTAQYRLLTMLADGQQNIFAVGDSDQSIYKWRGADFRNIERFRKAYPTAKQLLLEQNYRSTQIILDAAKAVIQHNPYRVHKDLFTDRQGGAKILLREAYNEMEEAETIVQTISGLMRMGHSGGDFAVMYRTNAQSRQLEEAFVRWGMPYRLVGATQFYRRREVKDMIAYLRLIHNPADAISLDRVLNVPTRGIGLKTRQQLHEWAMANGWQPATALLQLATNPTVQHPFRARAKSALQAFGQMLQAWITLKDTVSVEDLILTVLQQTDYKAYLNDGTQEGEDRIENVMELLNVASEADDETTLGEFLEGVALVAETDNLETAVDAPTLLTLHAAKGLEFPAVFLTGLEDGILPHNRSLDDSDELAEERRLFYVGLTRAKDRLYLSYAFRRTVFGDTHITTPSRFLADIPEHLLEAGSTKQRRKQAKQRASSWETPTTNRPTKKTTAWSPSSRRATTPPPTRKPAPEPSKNLPKPNASLADEVVEQRPFAPTIANFKTGETVSHKKFGTGTVIESKLVGNDEEVTVAFKSAGIKRLMASFAKLERLS